MNSFRHDPDGPENQAATRNCDRYVGALKLEHKLRNTCTHLDGHLWRPLGTAKDGTQFSICRRCGLEVET